MEEITDTIAQIKTMQLATVSGNQPWICTVYFVLHAGNFYWLSYPERRHSRELAENPRASLAVVVRAEVPVIGLQIEGDVALVSDAKEVEIVLELYVKKYGQGKRFVQRFQAGTNRHALYRCTPRTAMLFDEYNTSDAPYRKITLD